MVIKWPFIRCKFWWSICNLAKILRDLRVHFVSYLLNQLRFWLIKHIKTTVWTSVLWKILILLAKNGQKRSYSSHLQILFRFRTVYSFKAIFCSNDVPRCKSNALYYFPKVNVLGLLLTFQTIPSLFFFAASNLGVEHVYETPSKHEAVNGVTSPSSSARSSRLSAGSNGFFRDSGNDTMYTSSGKANWI